MHSQRRDVGRADHPPDGQLGGELGAARVQVSTEQRRGQGRVDEPGREGAALPRPLVPAMNSSVPPARTRPTESRATSMASHG